MSELTVNFSPLGVTFETVDRLFNEEHGADLVSLYMAYASISHWQKQYRPYATDSFVMKKLSWGESRFLRAKKSLVTLGLIQTHMQDKSLALRDEKTGRVLKTFILVNHLVTTTPHLLGSSKSQSLVNEEQIHSTNNKIHSTTKILTKIRSILKWNESTKLTDGRLNKCEARLKKFTEDELYEAAKNLSLNKWNMGENPSKQKYATLDYFLRNDEMVDRWLNSSSESTDDDSFAARLAKMEAQR